ncbi:FGGY-family carbohydrate kinase [Thermovenabulum sp.]|uniref:FGGY-family carbohydrate kinase n=1 Tax=Thermovenabulum sp. TaxID=3100335 RepID=UPI003C7BF8D5
MTKNYILGIDAGTTKIKAGLFDIYERMIDVESTNCNVLLGKNGEVEMNMDETWNVVVKVIKALLERNEGVKNKIIGIGVTGQGDGFWPLGKDKKPVYNAVLWNDTRAKDIVLKQGEEVKEICSKNNIVPLFAGAPTVILKWFLENSSENIDKVQYIIHCKDWINYNLTGEISTDYTDASTAAFDIKKREYCEEYFQILGIEDFYKCFPKPGLSQKIIGFVNKIASEQTGIAVGVPVIAGAIDVAAVAFGIGVEEKGQACTIIGTTLCNEVLIEEEDVDLCNEIGSTLCYVMPDKYLRIIASQSGTTLLDWIKNLVGSNINFDEIEKIIASIPIGSEGVVIHPYLYGERAPFKDPSACGAILGLSAKHTKANIFRAAYESLASAFYDCYSHMPYEIKEIFAAGGGSNSIILCQMFSDMINLPVKKNYNEENGILGVVKLVKKSLGITEKNLDKNKDFKVFYPDYKNHLKYQEVYNLYKMLQVELRKFWGQRQVFS